MVAAEYVVFDRGQLTDSELPGYEAGGVINSGTGRLRQVDVHTSPEFITEWLE